CPLPVPAKTSLGKVALRFQIFASRQSCLSGLQCLQDLLWRRFTLRHQRAQFRLESPEARAKVAQAEIEMSGLALRSSANISIEGLGHEAGSKLSRLLAVFASLLKQRVNRGSRAIPLRARQNPGWNAWCACLQFQGIESGPIGAESVRLSQTCS